MEATIKPFGIAGVPAALGAALLFGAGTPFAKLLLGGAILLGGLVGPVLLMWGLVRLPASTTSLLLNAEGVFTALLAWFVFHENFDRRIALGMALIVAGAMVLSWPGKLEAGAFLPSLAVAGACLAWAIDNNLTRKVSLADATLISMLKGLVAGSVNVALAWMAGAAWPALPHVAGAGMLGFFSYGLSLVLFVRALRSLGTARTGAYFSIAPFAGAALSIALLHEEPTWMLASAAALMGLGVWLHLTEHHVHRHSHTAMEHDHEHEHDAHHQHHAAGSVEPGTLHTHRHHHDPLTHAHEHYPDAHHRHGHSR